jgi:hypothetical protein
MVATWDRWRMTKRGRPQTRRPAVPASSLSRPETPSTVVALPLELVQVVHPGADLLDRAAARLAAADAVADLERFEGRQARQHFLAMTERSALVQAARTAGASWHTIATSLGMTAEGARKRYRALDVEPPS